MNDHRTSSEIISRLLNKSDKVEAMAWLRGHSHFHQRNIGEMSNSDSIALVQLFYSWGALEVSAMDIGINEPYESTDTLIIRLPQEEELRMRFFCWSNEHNRRMGLDLKVDSGQQYLLIWFD
jgi:hypothetical protein